MDCSCKTSGGFPPGGTSSSGLAEPKGGGKSQQVLQGPCNVTALARPLVAFHQEVLHQVAWQSQKVVEYHSEGEFLPEKFQFDARSEFYIDGMVPKRHENLDDLDSTDGDTDDDRDTCLDDRAEAESRRLDAMTLDAINCSDPFKMAHVGPGSNPGPRKYLGVVKPAILLRKYHHCSSTML